MTRPANEWASERYRGELAAMEPRSQRTFTPTMAVFERSAGPFHWTPEGRRLFDFTSGVLVTNLGHNPANWMQRFHQAMGWHAAATDGAVPALPLNAYNAITPIEIEADRKLLKLLASRPGGRHLQRILWAASGSEAVHKAIWACLRWQDRDLILATRHGFHGKKGLSNAVTGCETDPERDPRVKFITFPREECRDLRLRESAYDPAPVRAELDAIDASRVACLITEPYLGGGGSYHPHPAYLQELQTFCRVHGIPFILDEVQANFHRTGRLFAFEKYGLEPDLVVLGKSLGNGVPVAAVVGREDILDHLNYGESSDTWSANPISCAAVVATLEAYDDPAMKPHVHRISAIIEAGLERLRKFPFIAHLRGEQDGMVWGIETRDHDGRSANDWANELVLRAYRGDGPHGIHLLGPLAGRVVRVAPPLTISAQYASEAMQLLFESLARE